MLVRIDLICNQLSTKNENTIAHQSSQANADDVKVVVAGFRQQYFLRKKNGTPAKPERNLYGVHSAHHKSQYVRMKCTGEKNIFMNLGMHGRIETCNVKRQH